MAITNTTQAKEFSAGAPRITLRGDLKPSKKIIQDRSQNIKMNQMMASDDTNERALEQIFEQLLEEGFSIEEAAIKAREIFNQRAMADGGRVNLRFGTEGYQGGATNQGGAGRGTAVDDRGTPDQNMVQQLAVAGMTPKQINKTMGFTPKGINLGPAVDFLGKGILYNKAAPMMNMLPAAMTVKGIYDLFKGSATTDEKLEEQLEDNQNTNLANGGRVNFGLGSIFKGAKKAVKKVTNVVKDNPLLAAAALNFAPMLAGRAPFFGIGGLEGSVKTFGLPSFLSDISMPSILDSDAAKATATGVIGGGIVGLLAEKEQLPDESDADFANRRAKVIEQLKVQFSRLYPKQENESPDDYNTRITAMVEAADDSTIPVGEMAEGGRSGYAMGTPDTASKNAMQASNVEGLPIRQNKAGIKELDLRNTGGFIPPVGIKEKADDIPAMLSNNEFVFTADAVRAAGGGSVNKGAQRMYDLMKGLESKVV